MTVIVALGAFAAFIGLWRLGTAEWLQDEYVYATAGYQYAAGTGGENMEHPPLAKLLIGIPEHLFGFGPASARVAAVAAGIATGVALALIAARLAGEAVAVLTFALWVALPHPTPGWRLERAAMLDVFAACFAAFALLAALRWVERPGWRRAAVTGAAIGAAAACKLIGAPSGIPVVVFVLLSIRPLGRALRELGVAAGAAVAVFLCSYLPIRTDPFTAIPDMLRFQGTEADSGFPIRVAGTVYNHPPWWSPLWFAWHHGPAFAVATLIAAIIGLAAVERRVAALLGLAILAPFLAIVLGPGRFFEFYAYAWTPPLVLCAALGVAALWRRRRAGRAVAVVLMLPLVAAGAGSVWSVLTLQPKGYVLAGRMLDAIGARTVLIVGPRTRLVGYVCPGTTVAGRPDRRRPTAWDAIVHDRTIATGHPNQWSPPELRDHPDRFALTRFDEVDVYVRLGVHRAPCRES
jgi:4-amino-4-deoxy-L-arabinose transferase-like glycosyltransferase